MTGVEAVTDCIQALSTVQGAANNRKWVGSGLSVSGRKESLAHFHLYSLNSWRLDAHHIDTMVQGAQCPMLKWPGIIVVCKCGRENEFKECGIKAPFELIDYPMLFRLRLPEALVSNHVCDVVIPT